MGENQDIRQEIAKRRLRQYEVAHQLNISEFTFSRWLRCRLSVERKQKIMDAIDEITRNESVTNGK